MPTTETPVVIRQRVRTRIGGRGPVDSTIQTRPRGSNDEFVRFSAINKDSKKSTPSSTTPRQQQRRLYGTS